MTKAIDRPSTLFVMQIVVAVIGTLAMAIGSLTISQVESDIDHVNDKHDDFKLVTNSRIEKLIEKLDSSNNKINENQIIIHEMLTEMKWSKAQFSDLAERVKDMERK